LVLGAIMLWQTLLTVLAKNKKEKAIMQEFQKGAREAAAVKLAQAIS